MGVNIFLYSFSPSYLLAAFTWGSVNGVNWLTKNLNQHLPQVCKDVTKIVYILNICINLNSNILYAYVCMHLSFRIVVIP